MLLNRSVTLYMTITNPILPGFSTFKSCLH